MLGELDLVAVNLQPLIFELEIVAALMFGFHEYLKLTLILGNGV